jgi:hypothetical protein
VWEGSPLLLDTSFANVPPEIRELRFRADAGCGDTSSAAKQLIEALSRTYLQQFQRKVERYQDSTDPAEVERLRNEMSCELFGT